MLFRSLVATVGLSLALVAGLARAADRDKLEAFLDVTGYGVVIESLQQGAMAGPGLVGNAPQTFGAEYSALAKKVFDPKLMHDRALDILQAVMPDNLVEAGAAFYASDLGQRLVKVENESHLTDQQKRFDEGVQMVQKLKADDPGRLDTLKALDKAVGSEETGRKAIVEIQVRFLMAAMAAGASDLNMTEEQLRKQIGDEVKAHSAQTEFFNLVSNTWTYRDISDDDLKAYLAELETPEMKQVYELLNATQYQVMVERYQVLGTRLGELKPSQEL